ncbi:MAG: hypothetical protein AABY15_06270 [Nanoarchaeota archaeon]|mgnify:CR=1 FL=1
MIKLNVLKEKVAKSPNSSYYLVPIEISLEGESIDNLAAVVGDAERKLRNSGLSLVMDFTIDKSNNSIVNLSFREENINELAKVVKNFKEALEKSIDENKEREIIHRKSEKERERKTKEIAEKVKQIKFD